MSFNSYLYKSIKQNYTNSPLFTHNIYKTNTHKRYKKKQPVSLYRIFKENTTYKVKEMSGILLKYTKKNNLSCLHIIQLKKYNNIYLTVYNEAPNILN